MEYFEALTMKELYEKIKRWNQDREYSDPHHIHTLNIQKEGDMFCCIAIYASQPVVLTNGRIKLGSHDYRGLQLLQVKAIPDEY